MVNTNTLAQLAEELDLGSYLYLGKGIAKGGGRSLKSLLANAFEAVLGAMFLDAGYDAAYHYYLDRYRSLPSPARDENFKGRLQQVAQEKYGTTPFYDSEGARVGNHREYTTVVFAGAEPLGTGHGASKQEAEQDAARAALESLGRPIATELPLGKTPRPRARRAPRKKREPASASPAEAGSAEPAEVVPLPVPAQAEERAPEQTRPEPAPPPPVETRSRQFGEPFE